MGSGGGGGNSALSFSSLSALAPPFTIDRLNPKPNSNPSSRFREAPYVIEPFRDTWPYACPSAPTPELVVDSTGMTEMPLSSDYQFSASLSSISPCSQGSSSTMFSYGMEPYYSPCAPMVSDDYPLVEDNGARYDVAPTSGMSVSSQIDYVQSSYDLEYGPKWENSSGFDDGKRAKRVELDGSFSYEKANVGGSHSYNNQLKLGGSAIEYRSKSKEDICFSYEKFEQDFDREFDTGCISLGRMVDISCLEQNPSFSSYKSNKTHISTSSSTHSENRPCEMQKNLPSYQNSCSTYVDSPFNASVSVIRSSPTVVIRSPLARSENVTTGWPPKWKEPGLILNSEIEQDSYATDVKEFSSPLLTKDTFNRNIKARFGSQLPNINVTPDKYSSECNIDRQNSAVDSPCWKGAPPFTLDSTRTSFEKAGDCNKNAENECAVLTLEKTLDAIFSNRDESSSDDVSNDPNIPIKESAPTPPNNFKSGFHMKISDTIHFFGEEDVSESGGSVAVLAAEKVLASPASQEDEIKVRSDTKLDISIMIKTIQNLSELLLLHISDDACTLKEEYFETIELIRSNLDSFMSKKIDVETNEPEPDNLAGDSSKQHGESHNVGSHMNNKASDSKLDYPCMSKVKKSCSKVEKFAILGDDDVDITKDDDDDVMAQAIEKVLDENFKYSDEEMDSQAGLLFKSLWLEAEAKLCSISYKARFDRMRIEMEKSRTPKLPKGNNDVAVMVPKAHDSIISEPPIQNSCFSNTGVHANDIESSVMARFNILKSRENNLKEEQQTKMVDGNSATSSIVARLSILKSREESLKASNLREELQPEMKSEDEMLKDPIIVEHYSGWRDSSSSDWEHVVLNPKDNFAWKNS
ncbi:hypothetical protein ACJIZ3_022601 [Penstemon smallii]|uniref:Uncharacterized protein n=1 Tax=Penstemon smallii TaxID=265156 RepID=A0ABD3TLV6_9LAMI